MSANKRKFNRRDFIKGAGAAGLGSMLLPLGSVAQAQSGSSTTVPTRPYGKTGVNVPILGLGGDLGLQDLIVFRQAFKMGVTYWDTADSYGWGNNEKAIGKYFSKFPDHRSKIFLVTKAATSNPKKLTDKLNQSLQRMDTSYIDMYFIHYVSNVNKELTDEVKAWAERTKAQEKFDFSDSVPTRIWKKACLRQLSWDG